MSSPTSVIFSTSSHSSVWRRLASVGRKQTATRIAAGLGQGEVAHRPEEPVGNLHQHPGAVAGVGVGALGAPVLHVRQRAQTPLDGLVRRDGIEAGDQRDTAAVVLVSGVVEALHRLCLEASTEAWEHYLPPVGKNRPQLAPLLEGARKIRVPAG